MSAKSYLKPLLEDLQARNQDMPADRFLSALDGVVRQIEYNQANGASVVRMQIVNREPDFAKILEQAQRFLEEHPELGVK